MSKQEIREIVWQIAREHASRGPGWAQEGVVMRAIHEKVGGRSGDLPVQQEILDAWHDLFLEKKLGWGYNFDNPNSPFFHAR